MVGGVINDRRIHQVVYGGLGGHAAVALSLVEAMDGWRHSVTCFGDGPPTPDLTGALDRLDAQWTAVTKRPGLDLRALRAVYADIGRRRPTALVVHSTTTLPAVLAYTRRSGVPTLVVDHTSTDAKARREWAALALSLLASEGVTFLTPRAHEDAVDKLGSRLLARSRTFVIPNGINVATFAPGPVSAREERATITMLSRFTPVRDHISLMRALALCLKQDPELCARVRLVLAGEGTTMDTVKQERARLGLDHIVELPGLLGEADVVALLQRSTLYIQSSLADTMSTAVMQAMAVGLPVIATDIRGMDFLIDDGRTGLLVPIRDPEALAARMMELLRDPGKAAALGRAARLEAEARFSSEMMVHGYERALLSLGA